MAEKLITKIPGLLALARDADLLMNFEPPSSRRAHGSNLMTQQNVSISQSHDGSQPKNNKFTVDRPDQSSKFTQRTISSSLDSLDILIEFRSCMHACAL